MQVQLNPQDEKIVRECVSSGEFSNASEVVHGALIALEVRNKMRALREAIDLGLADVASGATKPWSRDLLKNLRMEAEERARATALNRRQAMP